MKQNLILKAAIALALGATALSASAATTTVAPTVFASELFRGMTPAATVLVGKPITVTTASAIPANSTVFVYLKLSSGQFVAAPTGGVQAAPAAGKINSNLANVSTGNGVLSTDGTYFVTQVNITDVPVGIGQPLVVFTPNAATGVNNAAGILNAPITVTASIGITSNTTTVQNDLDPAGTPTATFASSAQGITGTAAASSAFPFNGGGAAETARIDVAAATPFSLFTNVAVNAGSTTVVNLGALRYTEGATRIGDDSAAYTIAGQTPATPLGYTVTAPAGFFAALGTTGTIHLDTGADCKTGTLATSTSATFTTAAAAAAATAVTVAGAARPTNVTNYYVCMTVNGSTPMVAGTPSLTSTLTHNGTATDSNNAIAATNLYALALNGASEIVKTYVPAGAAGYTSFVRIINRGVAAPVSVSVIADNGTTGAPAVLIPSLASGASATLSSAQIEAVTGAINPASRPRLLLTAPSAGLTVQSFLLTNANGNYATVHGAD